MTPEEKTIERMRKGVSNTCTRILVLILWACLLVGLIIAYARFHGQLMRNHEHVREITNQSLLADLIVEQSRLEIQMSIFLATMLTCAVIFGLLVGTYFIKDPKTNLTVALWDKIQRIEEENSQRNRKAQDNCDGGH